MSPEVAGLLAIQILRLVNNIIEGIPVEKRHEWFRDNQKFWDDVFEKLSKGEFKLPEFKLPELKPVVPPKP